jgi:hypothetical protein
MYLSAMFSPKKQVEVQNLLPDPFKVQVRYKVLLNKPIILINKIGLKSALEAVLKEDSVNYYKFAGALFCGVTFRYKTY